VIREAWPAAVPAKTGEVPQSETLASFWMTHHIREASWTAPPSGALAGSMQLNPIEINAEARRTRRFAERSWRFPAHDSVSVKTTNKLCVPPRPLHCYLSEFSHAARTFRRADIPVRSNTAFQQRSRISKPPANRELLRTGMSARRLGCGLAALRLCVSPS